MMVVRMVRPIARYLVMVEGDEFLEDEEADGDQSYLLKAFYQIS